jgi:hypothetical protein
VSSCGAFIQFVTPSDVRALKTRLDPFVGALDAAIVTCGNVDAATRTAWTAFLQSWRAYVTSEDHFLTAGAEFNTGCEYETTIAGWQHTVGGLACGVPGPSLPAHGTDTATTSSVRTVAIAAGVVAVALTLRSLAR